MYARKPLRDPGAALRSAPAACAGRQRWQLLALQGIEPSADKEAVKQAYRLRALKYHPDVTGSDDQEARARFVQITEAYEARALATAACRPE